MKTVLWRELENAAPGKATTASFLLGECAGADFSVFTPDE